MYYIPYSRRRKQATFFSEELFFVVKFKQQSMTSKIVQRNLELKNMVINLTASQKFSNQNFGSYWVRGVEVQRWFNSHS
jgi:hypothetical protein